MDVGGGDTLGKGVSTSGSGQASDMSGDMAAELDRLHEQHRERTAELARIAEFAAEVHEQAAEIHEDLPDPQLDPEDLRRHAAHDRRLAAQERERLQEP